MNIGLQELLVGGSIIVVIYLVAAFLIYFLPSFVASMRDCEGKVAIIIINIFFAWTGIIWFVLLILSLVSTSRKREPAVFHVQHHSAPHFPSPPVQAPQRVAHPVVQCPPEAQAQQARPLVRPPLVPESPQSHYMVAPQAQQAQQAYAQQPMSIGRDPSNHIVVPDAPQVSGVHAYVSPLGGNRFEIRDAGSTNGISVNGQRVSVATIRVGDDVRFGTYFFDTRILQRLGT